MTDEQKTTAKEQPPINTEWDYFFAALMFYTRLPAPANTRHSPEILNGSRKYFPLIGIIIASIGAIVFLVSQSFLSIGISVALSMVATILATGAFHEDGFADSCDGLGGGWKKEQVLTIMKDSRVGTYATVGLVSILAVKFLSLNELATLSVTAFVFCLIAAHTFSRLCASFVIESYEYVQDIDASKAKPMTQASLSSQDKHATFIIAALPILILAFFALIPTLVALLVSTITATLFANYSEKRIGGYTGDILGAIQQLSEVAFYLTFLAML